MPHLTHRAQTIPASGIRAIIEQAKTVEDAIVLAIGEPDVPVAPHILAAGIDALERDETGYVSSLGIPALRAAIVEKLARVNNIHTAPDQVLVTAGGNQAIHLMLSLVLDHGDEVLVPNPGYANFAMTVHTVGGTVVPYPLDPLDGYVPQAEVIESLITSNTRVLLLNSPANPLGVLTPQRDVEALLGLARRHNLWVLSDECYEQLVFDEQHVSPASLDTDGRVFTAFSFSKTYAMTGLRVGYLVAPSDMALTLSSTQESILSCVNVPAQYQALAALTGSQESVAQALAHYRDNRRIATQILDKKNISYVVPKGGIYLWVDVSHVSRGDVARWTLEFLRDHRVALAPGTAFGDRGEGWVRICTAADATALATALGRLPERS